MCFADLLPRILQKHRRVFVKTRGKGLRKPSPCFMTGTYFRGGSVAARRKNGPLSLC